MIPYSKGVMKETREETIGERIAHLRQEHGWTQQALAERIAISRVAISHIEMNLSTPSERTITLLAGIFKTTPHDLVGGTTYPEAKAERLPPVVCSYTRLELNVALLYNDLNWLAQLEEDPNQARLAEQVRGRWLPRLAAWRRGCVDARERQLLGEARETLLAGSQAATRKSKRKQD